MPGQGNKAKATNHPHKRIGRDVGVMVAKRRKLLELSMDDVAKRAGITKQSLWLIESGKTNPSFGVVVCLFNVLNLTNARVLDFVR